MADQGPAYSTSDASVTGKSALIARPICSALGPLASRAVDDASAVAFEAVDAMCRSHDRGPDICLVDEQLVLDGLSDS
jgi:hypothetical protein